MSHLVASNRIMLHLVTSIGKRIENDLLYLICNVG